MPAPTDGTASSHDGCKKPKGIPINESALRDVEAPSILAGTRMKRSVVLGPLSSEVDHLGHASPRKLGKWFRILPINEARIVPAARRTRSLSSWI